MELLSYWLGVLTLPMLAVFLYALYASSSPGHEAPRAECAASTPRRSHPSSTGRCGCGTTKCGYVAAHTERNCVRGASVSAETRTQESGLRSD